MRKWLWTCRQSNVRENLIPNLKSIVKHFQGSPPPGNRHNKFKKYLFNHWTSSSFYIRLDTSLSYSCLLANNIFVESIYSALNMTADIIKNVMLIESGRPLGKVQTSF